MKLFASNLIISHKKAQRIYIRIQKSKGAKRTLEHDGFVQYLECGDGFTSVYKCQNLSNYTP